ncbi:MAG: rRNA maturation RNase YbeY [Alysiella sp.]|uniref:rRNA maturation RNase YbeY n=1 Tax=Alysiella sp. TaxID=1872483 RepID=UPI0026DD250C|nr:rRNA maturation RNase YbeY [Alysiella sp.]MDO4433069.1 rRNA maturation RNase YbeY [Alysiella sp.]
MVKKQSKHFPFLQLQKQRFHFVYENQSCVSDLPNEKQFYQWIWHALKNHYRRAEIALVLLDEDEARAYNRDYRGKDYATNVLSFAHNEDGVWLPENDVILRGDLIICPQVVAREAAEQGKNPVHHYAHLVIHGTLHLMGFDHIQDDEAEDMERLETQLLAQIGIADPYQAA